MFDAWFVFRPLSDDERYGLELWTDVPRPIEFEAFGLVLGIHLTALQKDIHWRRVAARKLALASQQRRVALVYRTFRRVVNTTRFLGKTEAEHVAMVAQQLGMSAQDVERALALAEDFGLADTV